MVEQSPNKGDGTPLEAEPSVDFISQRDHLFAAQEQFDTEDFNVIDFMNQTFSDKETLQRVDPLLSKLKKDVNTINAEILVGVRQQSISGTKARKDLADAKTTITELLEQIRDIQQKAQHSEQMVQDICRDIKKLDVAKTNLTSTITALRRLAMLINAVDQLQVAAERNDYADAAHLLGAVQQLLAHFRSYNHIPKVMELRTHVASLEKSLRITAISEFDLVGEELPSPMLLDRLKACCQVVNVLGSGARDRLVDNVCRREMGVYTQIFATLGDTARLERVVNRYKWFLRRMEARAELFDVFPESWQVPQLLSLTFCRITKSQLAEILDVKAAELPNQVENFLKAIEATNIFEEEMENRFKAKALKLAAQRTPSAEAVLFETPSPKSTSSSAVTSPVASSTQENKRHSNDPQQYEAARAAARTTFRGSISSVFVPHLHVYVEQVERELLWAMDQMIRSETWKPISQDLPVLRSSNELTDAIGAEVRQCTTRVTRGPALLEMASAFQRVYTAYAARLVARLPKTVSGQPLGTPILGGSEWLVKLGEGDVELICLVISTAEHCIEMLQQLQRALSVRLDPPSLAESLDMSEEEEEFRSVVSRCLTVLMLGLETMLENGLTLMSRHNWASVEIAGDQSDFVATIGSALENIGNKLAASMSGPNFEFFCDKLLRSFAPRFCENVFRCRKISDAGCQQLRLDVEAVKGALINMVKGGPGDPNWVQSFATDVNAHFGRPEAVLKVVGSPAEAMVETFFELLPQGAPADFQRMAELKVLKRPDLNAVLERYNKRIGKPGLLVHSESTTLASQRLTGFGGRGDDLANKFKVNASASSMKETMSRTLKGFGSMRFGPQGGK